MARRLLVALLGLAAFALGAQGGFRSGDVGLDATLNSINVQASVDAGSFIAGLSVEFGVEQARLQAWLRTEKLQPAEIYLMLELGRIAGRPPAAVLEAYKQNPGKGWGVVAQAMGIKPGSREFKALKGAAAERSKKLKAKNKNKS